MTKREALHIVQHMVRNQPETATTKQILRQLQLIEEEVCRKSWTKDKCLQALADWKAHTGKSPIVSNLGANGLPSKSILERVFGERASIILKIHFPDGYSRSYCDRIYSVYTIEQLTAFFREQVQVITPSSGADYNNRRLKGSPTWQTISRKLGYHSWKELYAKATGDTSIPSYKHECKILKVEVKSQLTEALQSILVESKGE